MPFLAMNYGLLLFTLPTFFAYYAHCEHLYLHYKCKHDEILLEGKDEISVAISD